MSTLEAICAALGGLGGFYAAARFVADLLKARQIEANIKAETLLTREHTGKFAAEGAKLHAESEKVTTETVRSWIDQLRVSSAKIEVRLDDCEARHRECERRSDECEKRSEALLDEMRELRRLMGLPT